MPPAVLANGMPIEVWFQDEARVGQQGTHAYVWAPKGARPAVMRDNRRDSAYIFGAICPNRRVGAAVIMPAVSSEAVNEHLTEISAMVPSNHHCALICDGAGWHQTGGHLKVPANITLIKLPPYAPKLNSMENVWQYLRENKLCAHVWKGYDAILAPRRPAWRFLTDDPDRIQSIGTRR